MNICFVANYNLTKFYDLVGENLNKKGVNIYWISPNARTTKSLVAKYGEKNVLRVGIDTAHHEPIGDLCLNELVANDRMLSTESWAFEYLERIQKPIHEFLKLNNIDYVFGELTWAHEILIRRIVASLLSKTCAYLNPHTIRMPGQYFGFFTDEFQAELFENTRGLNDDGFKVERKKPSYLAANNTLLNEYFSFGSRVKRFARFVGRPDYDPFDPTMFHSRFQQLTARLSMELNRVYYLALKKCKVNELPESSVLSVFLHKQPEASIDVVGRYYSDQLRNIRMLWEALPDKWIMVVKDHSNAIGDRGRDFYKPLRQLSRVYIVDHTEDSYALIERSDCIVSVSGTVCYESALSKKPSITLVPTFFNKLKFSNHMALDDFRSIGVLKILEKDVSGLEADEFEQWLKTHSFKGIISDPVSNPSCIEGQNIADVANAILTLPSKLH